MSESDENIINAAENAAVENICNRLPFEFFSLLQKSPKAKTEASVIRKTG